MRRLDNHWERANQRMEFPPEYLNEILEVSTLPEGEYEFQPVKGGLANTNYLIRSNDHSYFLKLFTRDQTSYSMELKLLKLIEPLNLPLADLISHGRHPETKIPFVIQSFIQGTPLNEFLVHASNQDIESLYFQLGAIRQEMNQVSFPSSGFLEEDMEFIPFDENTLMNYALGNLHKSRAEGNLHRNQFEQVLSILNKYKEWISYTGKGYLVHGDFKPSNFLVTSLSDKPRISGIIDWEFAFSLEPEFDLGQALRFENEFGQIPREALKAGYESRGENLSRNWYKKAKLYDLVNLLEFLSRPASGMPKALAHCRDLIQISNF